MKIFRMLMLTTLILAFLFISFGKTTAHDELGRRDDLPPEYSTSYFIIYGGEGLLETNHDRRNKEGPVTASLSVKPNQLYPYVLWYTDRPERLSGRIDAAYFFRAVWPRLFRVAPNAIIDCYIAPEQVGDGHNDGMFVTFNEEPDIGSFPRHRITFPRVTVRNWTMEQRPQGRLALTSLKITLLPNTKMTEPTRWSFASPGPTARIQTTSTPGIYTLLMENAFENLFFLSDGPSRLSYTAPLTQFLDTWKARFGKNPPNASLTSYSLVPNLEGGTDLQVHGHLLVLENPIYTRDANGHMNVAYRATILHGDTDPNRTFLSPTLLIDAAGGQRTVTLRNYCPQEIWVGAAGNVGTKTCSTAADCGGADCIFQPNQTSGTCASIHCLSNSDCEINQFCATTLPSRSTNCTNDSQCDATKREICDTNSTPGYFGPPDQYFCQTDQDCDTHYNTTNAFCDFTRPGATPQGSCGFHQCAYSQCYYVPVTAAGITTTGTACTANAQCNSVTDGFCYVETGSQQSLTGNCASVPQDGNGWDMAASDGSGPISIPMPTPWGGRFWPRTGCPTGAGSFLCDSGRCLGLNNDFSFNCAQSGLSPVTLAEFFFPPFDGQSNDFYDVSMVDSANVPVQINPNPGSYTVNNANTVSTTPCTTQNDPVCTAIDLNWVCDTVKKVCVNKFQCGSPGCAKGCEVYGPPDGPYFDPCPWGGPGLAVAESQCPASLQFRNAAGQYVGCNGALQACTSAPAGLDCSGASQDLYGCSGPNAGSCLTTDAGPDCCGCAPWLSEVCHNTNAAWQSTALPYVQVFHDACPNAYSFPYDDKSGTFTCLGLASENNVSYTVTFCPALGP